MYVCWGRILRKAEKGGLDTRYRFAQTSTRGGRGLGWWGKTIKIRNGVGGSTSSTNYYTQLAKDLGYSTKLEGLNVNAPKLVHYNNYISKLGKLNGWTYSNSAATVQGRIWQNQAIIHGGSLIGIGSTGEAIYINCCD